MPKNYRKLRSLLFAGVMCVCASASAKTDNKGFSDEKDIPSLLGNSANTPVIKRISDSIYNLIGLGSYGMERTVFYTAYKGYQYLLSKGLVKRKSLLTICDYSQSSKNKRLYVIDLEDSRLLFNTYVSHGRNSGSEYATSFSNLDNSNKSSLGFMITSDTYKGRAGYSMRFNGMEPGVNDHVRNRDIVLHGSYYVTETALNERSMLSKSLGCPAVPMAISKKIIDAIKGGSCYYAYYPDEWYLHTSRVLNSTFDLAPSAFGNKELQASTSSSSDAETSANTLN